MPQPNLTIYAQQSSPRLQYVLDWLFQERLGFTYTLTHSPEEAASAQYCIIYGAAPAADNAIEISAGNLLWESNTAGHFINRKSWRGLHTLYFDDDAHWDIPFDLLSGIFYLLSRYEEYFKTEKDAHGRFPHTASLQDFDGVLERPIIDEWVEYLRQLLERRWNIIIPKPAFVFEPTYDIDIAWKYRNKGVKRLLGAALRDVATLKISALAERFSKNDPWSPYSWLHDLHNSAGVKPRCFILATNNTTAFDKNILPAHPQMTALIQQLSEDGDIGLHPSYFTKENLQKMMGEKAVLERIAGKPITASRQHFIRLVFPQTYRDLLAAGITDDYSMGYSTHTGFRAGTSLSFLWYDLQKEETTALRIHPFCFMDTTAHYDMKLNTGAAFDRLKMLEESVRKAGGTLCTIFHNFSLGTDEEWAGWPAAYQDLFLLIETGA